MEELRRVAEKVEKGKHLEVPEEVKKALEKGIPPYDILINGLQAGLAVIGERFKRDECFIPEVLLAARAMHAGIDLLRPLLAEAKTEPKAKIVLGTVKDDLHDIGKNMVGMMLEGSGFRVIDVGVNVPAERFAEVVRKEGASLLAMSALLSTTMPHLKATIDTLKEKGMRDEVKVLVGGAPVTEEYAMTVGADGFAADAARAVDKAKELLNIRD